MSQLPPPLPRQKATPVWKIILGVFLVVFVGLPLIGYLSEQHDKHDAAERLEKATADVSEIESAIAQGKVMIGMTKAQARKAWTRPSEINPTTRSNNSVHEQWVFGDGSAGTRYLYFDDGILTTIQGYPWFHWDGPPQRPRPPPTTPTTVEQELKRRAEVLRRAGIDPDKQ